MKGTLFSADFINVDNDNVKLLEINTDTGFVSASFANFDFTGLYSVLAANSITKFHVIHKSIHTEFVEFLSQSLSVNVPALVEFTNTYEEIDSIYPTSVTDSADTFNLRLAYDESAILDSTYAKNNIELFKLFIDNDDVDSIAEFAYESAEFTYNNLDAQNLFNDGNVPDVAVKNTLTTIFTPLKFYKAGNSAMDPASRLTALVDSVKAEDGTPFIQKYYNSGTTHVNSIRTINIIYSGADLELLNIAAYEVDAILEKPSSLVVDDTVSANKLGIEHYFEFATNDTKLERGGVFQGQNITDAAGSSVLIEEVQIGDKYMSYVLAGSPDSDDIHVLSQWSVDGSVIPSGSYQTTSSLVNVTELDINFNLVSHIVLETGAEFRIAPAELLLVYDVAKDKICYKVAADVSTSKHKLFDNNGQLVNITTSEVEVLSGVYKSYELDLEEADTFFIETGLGGSAGWIKVLTHNCFTEGTQIYTQEGYKAIESFVPGDSIMTYDVESSKLAKGTVKQVHKAKTSSVINLEFSNGTKLTTTRQHPYYVEGKAWVLAKDLIKGDFCYDREGNKLQIENVSTERGEFNIYNLHNVIPNHTFFANDILVHNKICFIAGTEIKLANGDVKNIEDITIGDEVLSFNEESKDIEPNKVLELFSPVHDDLVEVVLADGNKITSTFDHPYYSEDGSLISYKPSLTESKYKLGNTIGELVIGSKLIDSDLNTVEVVDVVELERVPTQTYVFTVENNHNFFANGILVHNKL